MLSALQQAGMFESNELLENDPYQCEWSPVIVSYSRWIVDVKSMSQCGIVSSRTLLCAIPACASSRRLRRPWRTASAGEVLSR